MTPEEWRLRIFGFISLAAAVLISVSRTLPSSSPEIDHVLKLVADWQLNHLIRSSALGSEQEIGWVQATFYVGLARLASTSNDRHYFEIIRQLARELPRDYYSRERYEALFIEMADKLLTRQRPDGFWSASLLSRPELSVAESSGTAFFTYGIASGINLGLLDRGQFAKVALRGWGALIGALNADGRLGRVQQMDDRPGTVDVNDSQFYGSGALLLAGTAIKSMIESQ